MEGFYFMLIQPATILDLNSLRKLEQICFPRDAWHLFDLIAVLSFAGVIRLKAIENGRMIGFAAGDVKRTEGVGWIATLGVLPEYRGKGIGRALLSACEDQMNLPIIKLTVRTDNSEAIQMYRRAGYITVDTWRSYYNDGSDGLVMQKTRTAL
jgi:ribosomal-protein-alanine N-acetyltransferase